MNKKIAVFTITKINYFIFLISFIFRVQLTLLQQVPAQLPHTFYSGPFAKQCAHAVSMELAQQQLLLLQPQQQALPAQ